MLTIDDLVLTIDDLGQDWCQQVRARRPIPSSPLGSGGATPMGAVGVVCDVDYCNGVAFVDFGAGAIACTPDELAAA